MSNSNQNTKTRNDSPMDVFMNMGNFSPMINADPEDQHMVKNLAESLVDARADIISRSHNSKLSALRAQNPFVPIVSFPSSALTYLMAAGIPINIAIPSDAQFCKIVSDSIIYVNRNGNAQLPVAFTNATDSQNGSVMNPDDSYLYCGEMQGFSAISASNANISVWFFKQL